MIETTKDPVIISHANARSICDHTRNLSDEQIKALAEKKGVIGITFYPEFLSKKKTTINDVIKHIEYISNLVGVDYIGLGPDFIDYLGDLGKQILSTSEIYSRATYLYPEGIENVTKMPFLTEKLLGEGFFNQRNKENTRGKLS